MLAYVKRYFARRRLKPIVRALPWRLVKGWGSREHYTPPQVRRAVSDLRLNNRLQLYALAAACRFDDLQASHVALSADDYARLRAELAALFDLADDFSMKNVRRKPSNAHQPAEDNVSGNVPASWGGHN
jgi:hypothetical protein